MDPNSAIAKEVRRMQNFIIEKRKEFIFCDKLFRVQVSTKMLKREEFRLVIPFIGYVGNAIADCDQVLTAFSNDPNSDINYIKMFKEKEEVVVGLMEQLKSYTNFFRNKTIYSDEILEDLEKATIKFEESAE